jgi:hypothetical protein
MQEILMNTHKFWREIQQTKWHFWEERRVLPFVLLDFIEIHPIVAFEAIYETMLTSFWSLISFAVHLYIIMQYKGQHPPLLPKMSLACSCYYLHSQIDADKDSVFWLVNLHPSWKKIGCISISSKSVQVFWFKFLVWYTQSKNLNSRNLTLSASICECK